MNRPSRNDDTTEHPTWNQSPPFLASDLTTCEDLNGIANAREHRRGSDSDPNPAGIGTGDQKLPSETSLPHPAPGLYSCGRWSNGLCPLSKGSVVAVRQAPAGRRSKAVMSWIGWGASVLVASLLLNSLDFLGLVHLPAWKTALNDDGHEGSVGLTVPYVSVGSHPNPTPRALLIDAPVLTRRSTCSSGTAVVHYNLGLHIGALVIILCVSGFACAFSMIMRKLPRANFSPDSVFFFMVRHFGTGVLIATAFVHLLPTAFTYLGNPCLDGFWTNDYPAMPGAIALAGIFFVTIIEMVFSPHRHINQPPSKNDDERDLEDLPGVRENFAVVDSDTEADPSVIPTPTPQVSGPVRDMGPLRGRSNSISRQLSKVGRPAIEPTTTTHAAESSKEVYQPAPPARTFADLGHGGHGHRFVDLKQRITPEQQHKKDILQCMLLEMGILFHSVFIGMALSVSTGSEFVVLLIAISFHQTFEGLALGARIAAIEWPERSLQPWLMCLAYGCTTPIGQAIGIATHSLYDPNSEMGLILVGTMNAVSSGLLVFASLVELLSEDFLSDESWRVMRGKKRVVACLLLFAGAFGMSLVGAWA